MGPVRIVGISWEGTHFEISKPFLDATTKTVSDHVGDIETSELYMYISEHLEPMTQKSPPKAADSQKTTKPFFSIWICFTF